MTPFKTIFLSAAFLAVPGMALAQISTDAVTDKVKDKAVDTVMDNMTADDAMVAGKTLITGGSKEDAAKAVVKKRVEDKVDDMKEGASMGGVTMDDVTDVDLSKDGMIEAGKDMAKDKMMEKVEGKGSSTSYGDKAAGSAKTYTDKVPSSAATYGSAIIEKSGDSAPAETMPAAATPALPPVNCPEGTTAQADGTCMVTGDWGG